MSNTDPSNYAGSMAVDLGQILALQGTEVPMYTEADGADALREVFGSFHWYTNRADAHTFVALVVVDGDRVGAFQNFPTNPDAPDATDPANAPADDDHNPDPRYDPNDGRAKP